jgi:hypothetical protein
VVAVRDHFAEQLPLVLPVVVTFIDDHVRLTAYRDHLGLDIPVLGDPDRALYRAVGAGRGALHRVWSPGTIALYARLLRDGKRLRMPQDDTRQLGADVLADADGVIRRIWLPDSPDTRPPISELAAVASALV